MFVEEPFRCVCFIDQLKKREGACTLILLRKSNLYQPRTSPENPHFQQYLVYCDAIKKFSGLAHYNNTHGKKPTNGYHLPKALIPLKILRWFAQIIVACFFFFFFENLMFRHSTSSECTRTGSGDTEKEGERERGCGTWQGSKEYRRDSKIETWQRTRV